MVDKIMKAIRETEASAEKIVEEAETRSKDIVAEAVSNAEVIRQEVFAKKKEEASKNMALAVDKGNAKRAEAIAKIDEDILELKKSSSEKEDKVIDEILKALVS